MAWNRWYGVLALAILLLCPATVLAVNITFTPPPPPSPENLTDIGAMINWWQAETYGLFIYLLGATAIASVYLKTRSLSLTAVVLAVFLATEPSMKWGSVILVGVLAWVLYRVLWQKSKSSPF